MFKGLSYQTGRRARSASSLDFVKAAGTLYYRSSLRK